MSLQEENHKEIWNFQEVLRQMANPFMAEGDTHDS